MDLNGLKRCNDCFGYAAGDALICRVADALNDVFPGEACRIGGDEFGGHLLASHAGKI